MKRIILICLMSLPLWASGDKETITSTENQGPVIVATTSWTAAMARMGGVENPIILAPYEMKHPSEYELSPSDIKLLGKADMIIFAGYEIMVSRIKETLAASDTELVQINTMNSQAAISEAAAAIAEAAGTEPQSKENIMKLAETFKHATDTLKEENLFGQRVIVHNFQAPMARELGFVVVGTYGPQPLEPKKLGELAATECDIIIDNWHNPVGETLVELTGAQYVSFINFPGKEGTVTLFDVINYNLSQLKEMINPPN